MKLTEISEYIKAAEADAPNTSTTVAVKYTDLKAWAEAQKMALSSLKAPEDGWPKDSDKTIAWKRLAQKAKRFYELFGWWQRSKVVEQEETDNYYDKMMNVGEQIDEAMRDLAAMGELKEGE